MLVPWKKGSNLLIFGSTCPYKDLGHIGACNIKFVSHNFKRKIYHHPNLFLRKVRCLLILQSIDEKLKSQTLVTCNSYPNYMYM